MRKFLLAPVFLFIFLFVTSLIKQPKTDYRVNINPHQQAIATKEIVDINVSSDLKLVSKYLGGSEKTPDVFIFYDKVRGNYLYINKYNGNPGGMALYHEADKEVTH